MEMVGFHGKNGKVSALHVKIKLQEMIFLIMQILHLILTEMVKLMKLTLMMIMMGSLIFMRQIVLQGLTLKIGIQLLKTTILICYLTDLKCQWVQIPLIMILMETVVQMVGTIGHQIQLLLGIRIKINQKIGKKRFSSIPQQQFQILMETGLMTITTHFQQKAGL